MFINCSVDMLTCELLPKHYCRLEPCQYWQARPDIVKKTSAKIASRK